MRIMVGRLALIAPLCFTSPVWAQWAVDADHSSVNFASVKQANGAQTAVTEVHQFKQVLGQISDQGEVKVQIPVAALDTGIAVRDSRMHSALFQAEQFPAIEFTAKLDVQALKNMKAGAYTDLPVQGQLTIAGHQHQVETTLRYVQLQDQQALVSNLQPIVLDVQDFQLQPGIDSLREVAGLGMISNTVPVNFSLLLKPS